MTIVYTITDLKGNVKYIGKTRNLKERIRGHKYQCRNPRLAEWINGNKFNIQIIFQGDRQEARLQEMETVNNHPGSFNVRLKPRQKKHTAPLKRGRPRKLLP